MPFPNKNPLGSILATALFCGGLTLPCACTSPQFSSPRSAEKTSANWESAAPAAPVRATNAAPAAPNLAIGDPVLASLFKSAAQNSPRMAEQELNIAMNDAFRFRGWRQHLPFVNAGYGFGYFKLLRGDNRGNDENLGGTYNVGMRYPVFDWGATGAEKDAARLRERIAMQTAKVVWTQFVGQIRDDYYRAIILKNEIFLKKLQCELETRRVARETAHNATGATSANDFIAQSVTLRRLEAELQNATTELDNLVASIRSITGSETFCVEEIPETVPLPDVDFNKLVAQLESYAPETNADSLSAEVARLQCELADAEITQARSRMLPNLNLAASIAQNPVQTNTSRFEMQTTVFAGINGSWNIFDRQATQTTVRAIETRKRLIGRQLRSRNIYHARALTSQISYVRTLLQQSEIRKTNLENSRRKFAEMQHRHTLGMVEQIAVEDAKMHIATLERGILNDQVTLTRIYYQFLSGIEQDPAAILYTPPQND